MKTVNFETVDNVLKMQIYCYGTIYFVREKNREKMPFFESKIFQTNSICLKMKEKINEKKEKKRKKETNAKPTK